MADDIKKLLEEHKDEIKRHFGVVAEETKSEIKVYTEQIATNTEQITQIQQDLKGVRKDLSQVKNDVAIIKVAVGVVEGEKPLKQRVEELEAQVTPRS